MTESNLVSKIRFLKHDEQEALSSIYFAGQWAYTEYSSFAGPPLGMSRKAEKDA